MYVNISIHICICTLALCLFHSLIIRLVVWCSVLQCVAVCCSVLQCVSVSYSALQCVAVRCSVLQCVAVRCSALQCVAMCCSRFHSLTLSLYASLSLLLCRPPSLFLSVSLSVLVLYFCLLVSLAVLRVHARFLSRSLFFFISFTPTHMADTHHVRDI